MADVKLALGVEGVSFVGVRIYFSSRNSWRNLRGKGKIIQEDEENCEWLSLWECFPFSSSWKTDFPFSILTPFPFFGTIYLLLNREIAMTSIPRLVCSLIVSPQHNIIF